MLLLVPGSAHADVGSTIVGRLWESLLTTVQGRILSSAPLTVRLLQEAEKTFLGTTEDVTTHNAIRDVYKAMRVAGLLLLGLCTIISLAELAESGMLGQSGDLSEWIRRFCVAAFMTIGGIHFYGLWIRVFNVLLAGFRGYLDRHWTGPSDSSAFFSTLLPGLAEAHLLLMLVFVALVLVVLFVLWFLIGGIRMAELALSVIIAPLVWPVYLLPSLEDLPKTAFRGFLGLNASLLLIVGMLRLSIRMITAGGLATTVWNFVPAIAMLLMTVFLPNIIKRLIGQGNTGAGGLMTAVSALAGIKGVSMAVASAGGASAVASPPASAAVPTAPPGPSSYPMAPVPSGGSSMVPSAGGQAAPVGSRTALSNGALAAGTTSGRVPRMEEPGTGPWCLDVTESCPGSGKFDNVSAMYRWRDGYFRGRSVD